MCQIEEAVTSALVCAYDQHPKEQLSQRTCKKVAFYKIICPNLPQFPVCIIEESPLSFKTICVWILQPSFALIVPLILVGFWEQKGNIQGHSVLLSPFSLGTIQHEWQIEMGAIKQACEQSMCCLLSRIISRNAFCPGKDNGMRLGMREQIPTEFLIYGVHYITVTGYFRALNCDPSLPKN